MTESRKRSKRGGGQLIWVGKSWSGRYWATVDGERVRRCVSLGTDSRAVAKAKLARLVAGESSPTEAARPETFEQAARRIVGQQATEGLASWKDRLARLERYAFPVLGQLAVTEVRPNHVRSAVTAAFEAGKAKGTTQKLLVDCSTILGELWRDEVIPENAAARVRVPKGAPVNDRERVVLTDAEFQGFMACPDVHPELHTMALVSRTFGGARTSDLHAWDWGHVDTVNWIDAHVPRPKTKTKDRLALPDVLVPVLRAWWHSHGRPASGPVFPIRKGKRAGERKRGRISYAKQLRA
ncbi:MAG TPA: site-specific integrase, partial [Polyangiaceae bacterium]|nr:site-specific integrase [Polyangiaceae bacterium]